MSYEAEKWARSLTIGNARAKFVLIELANCLNDDTGKCCPSLDHLCEVTELQRHTVIKAIKLLVEKKLIQKTAIKVSTGRATQYDLIGFIDSVKNDTIPQKDSDEFNTMGSVKNNTMGSDEIDTISRGDSVKNDTMDSVKFDTRTYREIDKSISLNKKNKQKKDSTSLVRPEDVTESVFQEWVGFKKKVSRLCTQRMIDAVVREAKEVEITTEEAMIFQMEKGWKGFTAEWYRNDKNNQKVVRSRVKQPEKDFTDVKIPNGGGSISEIFGF